MRGDSGREKPAKALRRPGCPTAPEHTLALHPHCFLGQAPPATLISSLTLISHPCDIYHPLPTPGQARVAAQPCLSLPQDDMHRVIDRQLMDTHLKERSLPAAAAFSRAHSVGRGAEPSTTEGKWLFSFFRKI